MVDHGIGVLWETSNVNTARTTTTMQDECQRRKINYFIHLYFISRLNCSSLVGRALRLTSFHPLYSLNICSAAFLPWGENSWKGWSFFYVWRTHSSLLTCQTLTRRKLLLFINTRSSKFEFWRCLHNLSFGLPHTIVEKCTASHRGYWIRWICSTSNRGSITLI